MILLALLLAIGLPAAIGLSFLAEPFLSLIYKDEDFLISSQVLRILVWIVILMPFTRVLGAVLMASLRERVTLRIVLINAVVILTLGLLLISQFGLIGAAVATLLIAIVDFLQHYLPVSKLFGRIPLLRLLWKPFVASLCMAAFLALVRSQSILLIVLFAAVVYIVVLLFMIISSDGEIHQFRAKYEDLWSH